MAEGKLHYIKVWRRKVYGCVIEQMTIEGEPLKLFISYFDGKVYKLTNRKVYTEEEE